VPDHASADSAGKALSEAGGKTLTLAQLRKLSTSELDARVSSATLQFGPVIDGLFFPNDATLGADTNDTPILTGMTANEFTGLRSNNVTTASFNADLNSTYGKFAQQFAVLYPAGDDKQAWVSTDAISRDRGLASMYVWARERLAHTRYPIYAYLWTHIEPGPDSAHYLAFHSSEIPYVFGTLDVAKRPFTANDRKLSVELSTYWLNFVKTGNPNGGGQPRWPQLTVADKQILELGDSTRPRVVLDPERLQLFDRVVKAGGQLSLF
jgi:para-nitrobenzyl esterase